MFAPRVHLVERFPLGSRNLTHSWGAVQDLGLVEIPLTKRVQIVHAFTSSGAGSPGRGT
jgi:hypothetical protein